MMCSLHYVLFPYTRLSICNTCATCLEYLHIILATCYTFYTWHSHTLYTQCNTCDTIRIIRIMRAIRTMHANDIHIEPIVRTLRATTRCAVCTMSIGHIAPHTGRRCTTHNTRCRLDHTAPVGVLCGVQVCSGYALGLFALSTLGPRQIKF